MSGEHATTFPVKENSKNVPDQSGHFRKPLEEIYHTLKLYFYREMALQAAGGRDNLSIAEAFCMECIYALGEPTIAEFARFMNISSPNATYKIHSLVDKGYLEKIQSEKDKRLYHLRPTKKYMAAHRINKSGTDKTLARIADYFPEKDVILLSELLTKISKQLVPKERS